MDDIDRQSRIKNYGTVLLGHIGKVASEGTRIYNTFSELASSIIRLGAPEDLFDDVLAYVVTEASRTGLSERYHELPMDEEKPFPSQFDEGSVLSMSFGHVHRALGMQRPPRGGILGVFVNVPDAAGEEGPEERSY